MTSPTWDSAAAYFPTDSPTLIPKPKPIPQVPSSPEVRGSETTAANILADAGAHPSLPDESLIEGTISMQGRRVRKACILNLNACNCRVTITDEEIEEGEEIMKCQVPGCETVWVSTLSVNFRLLCLQVSFLSHLMYPVPSSLYCMGYEFVPKQWACKSCRAGSSNNRRHCA